MKANMFPQAGISTLTDKGPIIELSVMFEGTIYDDTYKTDGTKIPSIFNRYKYISRLEK